ncbi:MAG TPA: hypothetical protein VNG53_01025 [Bacteroidia bacterium]|nr:hypothetical protein [Bacteroidia bacterium]
MKKSACIKYAIANLQQQEMTAKTALDKATINDILKGLKLSLNDAKRLECFGGIDNLLMAANGVKQRNLLEFEDVKAPKSFIKEQIDFF